MIFHNFSFKIGHCFLLLGVLQVKPVNKHVSRQARQQWDEDIRLGFPYSQIHSLLVTSVYASH